MGEPTPLPQNSEIDVEQIGQLPALLETLQGWIETNCIGQMTNIKAHLSGSGINMDAVDINLNSDATPFGGFYSAYGVSAKASSSYKAVNETLHNLAKTVGELIEPTRQIAQNYQSTEDRNRAGMADIKKLLDDGVGTYKAKDPDAVDNTNEPTATAKEPRQQPAGGSQTAGGGGAPPRAQ